MTDDEISELCRRRGHAHSDYKRPDWATHRIIYALSIEWEKHPGDPSRGIEGMIVWLDRSGQAVLNSPTDDAGKPKPPKARTVDLREGDEVMTLDGRWEAITEIYAYRAAWLTPEWAAGCENEGYVYELPPLITTAGAASNA